MRLAISYIAALCLIAVLLVYSYQWVQQPSSALLKSRDEVAAEIELGWRGAKGIPFNVSAGIEIARQDANQAWSTLIFVCDGAGVFHLILRTRLPVPDDFRGKLSTTYSPASLFVGGIERQLRISARITAEARKAFSPRGDETRSSSLLDTIVTAPLSINEITALEDWFGRAPPTKVSFIGVEETGVFMVGTRTGQAIREFRKDCPNSRG